MNRRHRSARRAGALVLTFWASLSLAGCAAEDPAPEQLPDPTEAESADEPVVPPRVSELTDDFESVYALGSAILEAIEAGDFEGLMRYGIDEPEWYHIVWPELPASQPGRNLPWEYAWGELDQKSRAAARRTLRDFGGRAFRLVRVEFAGETTDYETYDVHRDARCVVEGEDGEIITLDLFGSVIERNGRFKAFSYVVD